MKTIFPKSRDIHHKWYLIDAEGKVLGRLAAVVARIVQGKTKPTYVPYMDVGDCVVIVNAEKVLISGRKRTDKTYYRHSGFPGGLKSESYSKVISRKPTFPVEHAVKGMLPKGTLGKKYLRKVKVYAGSQHPHEAQKPEILEL